MEQADSCRRAASEAIADVEPPQLHDYLEATLDEASMVPGVLTLESATAAAAPDGSGRREFEGDLDTDHSDDSPNDSDGIATQAAGVQLIYEGLRLTRSLAHDEPWTTAETGTTAETADGQAGDLEILAADILVARGFYLLARTDAAGKAVRTVQAFGRDQTQRSTVAATDGPTRSSSTETTAESATHTDDNTGVDPATIDANLERNILELAVLTGTAAVGTTPSSRLLATAETIADAVDTDFPPVPECLDGLEPSFSEQSLEEQPTDRATSATDP
ncbi:DUF7114 family protein [Natronorubrum thiooxidans]|uniref:Uncharacterized protein n=1 Tax=Natronorubrum thiooxidans TaxID=308853 RepID=A0A1N7G6H6_9EURY|nr:hypothetical protein [Natronorubrum thiooxidans]SIS08189.1 hypothetical protein SAMN05421752_11034 [Natronorubrum thiooxidans]